MSLESSLDLGGRHAFKKLFRPYRRNINNSNRLPPQIIDVNTNLSDRGDFRFRDKHLTSQSKHIKPDASLPFEFHKNLIFVQANINGRGPLTMMLDTVTVRPRYQYCAGDRT